MNKICHTKAACCENNISEVRMTAKVCLLAPWIVLTHIHLERSGQPRLHCA